ncbi:MAG: hypothetical protein HY608_08440 [Planctomycetes bacterium]|nr:hypothetical protein [Planctomycetota bacterium]
MQALFLTSGAFLCLTLQGAGDLQRTPDWPLAWAIFLGCYAPPRGACLGAWATGLTRDLASATPIGLHTLPLLAATLCALRLRPTVFREHPLTQAALGFLLGLPAIWIEGAWLLWAGGSGPGADTLREAVLLAAWTGWGTPILFAVLRPLRTAMGLAELPDLSR